MTFLLQQEPPDPSRCPKSIGSDWHFRMDGSCRCDSMRCEVAGCDNFKDTSTPYTVYCIKHYRTEPTPEFASVCEYCEKASMDSDFWCEANNEHCKSCCECEKFYCSNCVEYFLADNITQCSTCNNCENCCSCWYCYNCSDTKSADDDKCENCDYCSYCCTCKHCDNCGEVVQPRDFCMTCECGDSDACACCDCRECQDCGEKTKSADYCDSCHCGDRDSCNHCHC